MKNIEKKYQCSFHGFIEKLSRKNNLLFQLLLLALVITACTPRPASPVSPIVIDTPAHSPSMNPTNIDTLTVSLTQPLNPALLTPSAESARLGDILLKVSADLPCQEYGWSSIVMVNVTEAQFECSYTDRENKNTIYISFRLSGDRLGFECFHGYIASSSESSYPVHEGGENGKTSNSYTHNERFFTWTAQGVNFTIIEFIDGNQNPILASPYLREKIYEKVTQEGLITGDGDDCAQ